MRKPIIAIDMDDTIVFLMKAIMKHHNDNHTEHILAYENMAAFKHDVFHPDYDIMAYLKSNDTYRHLELMDEYNMWCLKSRSFMKSTMLLLLHLLLQKVS
jgi:5'(3')-deoxyribonucleotidase